MTVLASAPSLSRKIIRNTIFNSIGRFWSMLITLLLAPYIISVLGVQTFGIWSLVLALTGYIGLLDLGVGTSFVKHISEYYTKQDLDAINSVVNTGFVFYLVVAIIVITLVLIFGDSALKFFRIPAEIWNETRFVLIVAAAIYCLSNTFGVFQAVITGLQRMDVTNAITVAMSIPNVIGTVVFLQLGYGLKGLAINQAMLFMLTTALTVTWSFRLLPQLRLSPLLCRKKAIQELVSYGIRVQITKFGANASLRANNILVAYFLGLDLVAFYELGFKIAYTTASLPRLLVSAIMPAASELETKKDSRLLRALYRRGSKYLVLVVAPLAFYTILNARLIMSAWMGAGYERSALVIQVLTASYCINLLITGSGTAMARGIGKPGYETRYALIVLVIHVVLAIMLLTRIGFIGVLIATLIAAIVGSVYFMYLFHRHLREPFGQFVKQIYLKPILACLIASFSIYSASLVANLLSLPSNRMVNLAILGLNGCVFGGVYLIAILKSGHLDSYDQEIFSKTKSMVTFLASSCRAWNR